MDGFHLFDEIGRGKGSVVYKGRKKKTIEYVAIKSVEKHLKNRVLNEVSIMYALEHANILKFINWYETNNHIWLIVEYCTGGDLLRLIKQDKKLPEAAVAQFGRDIIAGLQYVHAAGYIYVDLKPSNVLINEFGELKLCDFGLAQSIPTDLAKESKTKRGTPYYMAPELFHDTQAVHSFASDFWAFGCLLYELAAGRPPFHSKSVQELVTSILNVPTPTIPHFSSAFNDLLALCLAKQPSQRANWSVVRNHPFWALNRTEPIATLTLPPEPVWDSVYGPSTPLITAASGRLPASPAPPTAASAAAAIDAKHQRKASADSAPAPAVTIDSRQTAGASAAAATDSERANPLRSTQRMIPLSAIDVTRLSMNVRTHLLQNGHTGPAATVDSGTAATIAAAAPNSSGADTGRSGAAEDDKTAATQTAAEAERAQLFGERLKQRERDKAANGGDDSERERAEVAPVIIEPAEAGPGAGANANAPATAKADVALRNFDTELDFGDAPPPNAAAALATGPAAAANTKPAAAASATASAESVKSGGSTDSNKYADDEYETDIAEDIQIDASTSGAALPTHATATATAPVRNSGGSKPVNTQPPAATPAVAAAQRDDEIRISISSNRAMQDTIIRSSQQNKAQLQNAARGPAPPVSTAAAASADDIDSEDDDTGAAPVEPAPPANGGDTEPDDEPDQLDGSDIDVVPDIAPTSPAPTSAANSKPKPAATGAAIGSRTAPLASLIKAGGTARLHTPGSGVKPAAPTSKLHPPSTATANATAAAVARAEKKVAAAAAAANSKPSGGSRPITAPVKPSPAPGSTRATTAGPASNAASATKSVKKRTPAAAGAAAAVVAVPIPAAPLAAVIVPSVDALLLHASDIAIKPLVGNAKIEKLPTPRLPSANPKAPSAKAGASSGAANTNGLPFKPLSVETLLSLEQTELETFFTGVYRAIGGSSSIGVPERVRALVYVETIVVNTAVANMIINSSLMTLFIKQARTHKSPALKTELLQVMGLLLRHATYLSPELAASGIVLLFSDLLRDAHVPTRRRAACALGELLFYIATQPPTVDAAAAPVATATADDKKADGDANVSVGPWQVSSAVVKLLCRCLRTGEDDIVRHYVIKTIENIAASHIPSPAAAPRAGAANANPSISWFNDPEVLFSVFTIYNTCNTLPQQPLRVVALNCIGLLLRTHTHLLPKFIEKIGCSVIVAALEESNVRLQVAALNVFNLCLKENPPRFIASLAKEKRLVTCLLKLIDSAASAGSETAAGASASGAAGGGADEKSTTITAGNLSAQTPGTAGGDSKTFRLNLSTAASGGMATAVGGIGTAYPTATLNCGTGPRALLRAKTLVALTALAPLSLKTVTACCATGKLMASIDRIARDVRFFGDEYSTGDLSARGSGGSGGATNLSPEEKAVQSYVLQCLQRFVASLPSWLESLLAEMSAVLSKVTSRKHIPPDVAKQLASLLELYPVTLHVLNSVACRQSAATPLALKHIASHVAAIATATATSASATPSAAGARRPPFPGFDEFREVLLAVCTTLSQCPEILLSQSEAFTAHILPAIFSLTASSSAGAANGAANEAKADATPTPSGGVSTDTRFVAVKMATDMLHYLLRHASTYDPTVSVDARTALATTSGGDSKSTAAAASGSLVRSTQSLNAAFSEFLFPKFVSILSDEDPIPQYGLKLLSTIVDVQPAFVRGADSPFHARRVWSKVVQFFTPSHPNNNIHNAMLVRAVVLDEMSAGGGASGTASTTSGEYSLRIIAPLIGCLSHAVSNSHEWFYEPLIDSLIAILQTITASAKSPIANRLRAAFDPTLIRTTIDVLSALASTSDEADGGQLHATGDVVMKAARALELIRFDSTFAKYL